MTTTSGASASKSTRNQRAGERSTKVVSTQTGKSSSLAGDSTTLQGPANITGYTGTSVGGLNNVYGSASVTLKPTPSPGVDNSTAITYKSPAGFKVNLPPHQWSLPVRTYHLAGGVAPGKPDMVGDRKYTDGTRRSIMWLYSGSDVVSTTTTQTNIPAQTNVLSVNKQTGERELYTKTTQSYAMDSKWAFQFLWNPTDISVSLNRNMDVTPSSADRFNSVAGIFPGQENITFTITLDRTWDFACLKRYTSNDASKFYKAQYDGLTYDVNTQISELMKKGTAADLEYLFKVINSDSSGSSQWTNALGRKTADIGYLMPNVIAVQFGPPSADTLSYVGWISNLQFTHTAFTESMIPIRTTVQVSMDCLAASTMGSAEPKKNGRGN